MDRVPDIFRISFPFSSPHTYLFVWGELRKNAAEIFLELLLRILWLL